MEVGNKSWLERVSRLASTSQQNHSPPKSHTRSRSFSPRPSRVPSDISGISSYDQTGRSDSRNEVMSKLRQEASYNNTRGNLELPRHIEVRSIVANDSSSASNKWNSPPASPPVQQGVHTNIPVKMFEKLIFCYVIRLYYNNPPKKTNKHTHTKQQQFNSLH